MGCNQAKEEKTESSVKNQTKVVKTDTIANQKTKMELFTSKTGTILKFTDFKLSKLNVTQTSTETRIRKVESEGNVTYFYQIIKPTNYTNKIASIEYSDLLKIIEALGTLKAQESKDIATSPDYLENKFITVDGFQVGYYVSKDKSSWYIQLEKYGSDNSVFVKDVSAIETAFNEAKSKIEELNK